MDDGRYTVRVMWGCMPRLRCLLIRCLFGYEYVSSPFGAVLLEHLIAFVSIVELAMRNVPSRLSARVRFVSAIDKRPVHMMHLACDFRRVCYATPDMVLICSLLKLVPCRPHCISRSSIVFTQSFAHVLFSALVPGSESQPFLEV